MAAGNIKAEMIPTMATANKTSVKVYPLFAQLNFLKKLPPPECPGCVHVSYILLLVGEYKICYLVLEFIKKFY